MAKPIAEQIAAVKARKEKLAARLSTLSAKAKVEGRKRDTRRKIVVGGAILDAIEKDKALASKVRQILADAVSRPHDRGVIEDLL
jgi:hypothetical protein